MYRILQVGTTGETYILGIQGKHQNNTRKLKKKNVKVAEYDFKSTGR